MKGYFYTLLKTEFVDSQLCCTIHTKTLEEAEQYGEFSNIECEIIEVQNPLLEGTNYEYCVKWDSSNAIDLLCWLNQGTEIFSGFLQPLNTGYTLQCKIKKTLPNAVVPSRAHYSDSGYDLTLVKHVKTVGDVMFYDTGIVVEPPHGYYFDLVPRSSISKTGYMLANSVGIIDQNYRGNILVPLRKISKESKDIELPAKVVQLIPRQWVNFQLLETECSNSTMRGEGGFGSTGV